MEIGVGSFVGIFICFSFLYCLQMSKVSRSTQIYSVFSVPATTICLIWNLFVGKYHIDSLKFIILSYIIHIIIIRNILYSKHNIDQKDKEIHINLWILSLLLSNRSMNCPSSNPLQYFFNSWAVFITSWIRFSYIKILYSVVVSCLY